MDDMLRTPKCESRRLDDDLSLQSPPMLAQTPHVRHSGGSPEDEPLSVFAKRTIADIATPRKPGSSEARVQEEAAYVNSPARAPPSTKRLNRSESPLGFKISLGHEDQGPDMLGEVAADYEDSLLAQSSCNLLFSPPKFTLATESGGSAEESRAAASSGDDDMLVEYADEHTTVDAAVGLDVGVDVSELESEAMDAEDAVVSAPTAFETTDDVAVVATAGTDEGQPGEGELGAESDSDIEFTTAHTRTEADSDTEFCFSDTNAKANEDSSADAEEMDCSTKQLEDEPIPATEPMLSALDAAFPALDDTCDDDAMLEPSTPVPAITVARLEMPAMDHSKVERAELTTAKILSDPELLYAASIPLPGTPALANQSTPAANQAADSEDSADFYIPTTWLMNPSTGPRNDRSQPQSHTGTVDHPSPSLGSTSAEANSLIPVTPANQRLLDSLEIQWVSPRRVPKFSDVDMEAVRTEYEEKMRRQNELREMLLEALKEEYAANMRKHEDVADQALREAEELFQKHAAQREREFEERLRAAETNHLGEIARRDEDTRVQEAQLSREIENLITERADISNELAQTRQTLDEYVATSGRLMDEKDSEINGLTRELAKLTLDRQRLQEQLSEAVKNAEDLFAKNSDAMQLIDALEAAKKQSDELNNNLHHDVLVSEERAAKIKEYAEGKLGEANAEIASAHEQLAAVRQDAVALKAQATKSDARARSLQIQLDSTKRQNEELLALCERLEGSF
ncbi:hypothetical protein GGI19_001918 [Coemansia pectinata]|uniref:Transforming acidic coiled-coil-containing protein C-terminal domain-containing protein n=1 Tax=Coemansia pectinata TaxID=1052879 RepID=A0A9W8H0L7_9FUNG|nr:hypothetical protein GGI19_001918 [Coemansia pectinata]